MSAASVPVWAVGLLMVATLIVGYLIHYRWPLTARFSFATSRASPFVPLEILRHRRS